MSWNTHHDSQLCGGAANSAIVLGAQRLFWLRYSLHRTSVRLAVFLTKKNHWALKCVSQVCDEALKLKAFRLSNFQLSTGKTRGLAC